MENERNTQEVCNHEKAREFNESVNHLFKPIEQWVKEDDKNRAYILILSRKDDDKGILSIGNACGNKSITEHTVAKTMEASDGFRKLIIAAQKMFLANTIRRMISESDDDDEIEPEVDYDDRGEEVDDTDKPEGGER